MTLRLLNLLWHTMIFVTSKTCGLKIMCSQAVRALCFCFLPSHLPGEGCRQRQWTLTSSLPCSWRVFQVTEHKFLWMSEGKSQCYCLFVFPADLQQHFPIRCVNKGKIMTNLNSKSEAVPCQINSVLLWYKNIEGALLCQVNITN